MSCRVFNVARSIASAPGSEIGCASGCARRFASRGRAGSKMNEKTPDRSSFARQGTDYGESSDVQEVHAAIQREKREPRVGLEPLSIWLIAVYGLAIFLAGAYLGRYSGTFSGDGLDPLGGPPSTKKAGAVGPGGGPAGELT